MIYSINVLILFKILRRTEPSIPLFWVFGLFLIQRSLWYILQVHFFTSPKPGMCLGAFHDADSSFLIRIYIWGQNSIHLRRSSATSDLTNFVRWRLLQPLFRVGFDRGYSVIQPHGTGNQTTNLEPVCKPNRNSSWYQIPWPWIDLNRISSIWQHPKCWYTLLRLCRITYLLFYLFLEGLIFGKLTWRVLTPDGFVTRTATQVARINDD